MIEKFLTEINRIYYIIQMLKQLYKVFLKVFFSLLSKHSLNLFYPSNNSFIKASQQTHFISPERDVVRIVHYGHDHVTQRGVRQGERFWRFYQIPLATAKVNKVQSAPVALRRVWLIVKLIKVFQSGASKLLNLFSRKVQIKYLFLIKKTL